MGEKDDLATDSDGDTHWSRRKPIHQAPVLAISGYGWLAVITPTTGVPALEAGVEEAADAMAASLSFQPPPSAPRG